MKTSYSKYGTPKTVEAFPLSQLRTDPRYQRGLSENFVKQTLKNFDSALGQPILVSRRIEDMVERYYILNGQHMAEIARRMGYSFWRAEVFEDLTPEQEAQFMLDSHRNRRGHSPFEEHRASVASGEERAVDIENILVNLGFKFAAGGRTRYTINAVRGIENVASKYGLSVLQDYLSVVRYAKDGDQAWTESWISDGLGLFIAAYQNSPKFDMDRLTRTIAKMDYYLLKIEAGAGLTRLNRVVTARSIHRHYCKGLASKNVLDINKISAAAR